MTNLSLKIENIEILDKLAELRSKGVDVREIFEKAIREHYLANQNAA